MRVSTAVSIEFSQTFTTVAVSLWKLGRKVFYFFYRMNTQKIFYCMAELVHSEKEHSDWFPERFFILLWTAK